MTWDAASNDLESISVQMELVYGESGTELI